MNVRIRNLEIDATVLREWLLKLSMGSRFRGNDGG